MTIAQQDDAGFRRPIHVIVVTRGKRKKHPFTVHVRPRSTGNKKRGA